MCGRFALQSSREELTDFLGIAVPDVYTARYNIAPTAPVLAVSEQGLTFYRCGLIPSWSKDPSRGNRMFNARAETVAEKPSFRNAFKRRRCLVPATGFYEWKPENGGKQPYFCHLDQQPFCFAGIWEHWQDDAGNELNSCAILTSEAVGTMADIHTRMPVVLNREQHADWLLHQGDNTNRAIDCLAQMNADFSVYPVSRSVNSTRNDSPDLTRSI